MPPNSSFRIKIIRTLPRTPFGVYETPAQIAEAAPAAYYYAPPETLDRPGVFYVNTSKVSTRPKFEMEVLSTSKPLAHPRPPWPHPCIMPSSFHLKVRVKVRLW